MPVEKDSAGFGEIFNASTAADYEFAEIDFFEGDFVDEVIALCEREKSVEQRGGSAALGHDLGEGSRYSSSER